MFKQPLKKNKKKNKKKCTFIYFSAQFNDLIPAQMIKRQLLLNRGSMLLWNTKMLIMNVQ